jgi:TRAP-type C4-dicarboxylate transport system substrate-binding protein
MALAALLAGTAGAAMAQEIMLRATANSNEQDEDYDGLVVFKNYVENASNGAIGVEIFMGTQLCAMAAPAVPASKAASAMDFMVVLNMVSSCWFVVDATGQFTNPAKRGRVREMAGM